MKIFRYKPLTRFFNPKALLFGVVIILFFFDFISLNLSVTDQIFFSGWDMLSSNKISVQDLYFIDTKPNTWAIAAFLLAIAGWMAGLINFNYARGLGFLFALAGLACMLMLQIGLINFYELKDYSLISLQFSWAYWLAIAAFAVAGSISYLNGRFSENRKPLEQGGTAIHINIINQQKDAENK